MDFGFEEFSGPASSPLDLPGSVSHALLYAAFCMSVGAVAMHKISLRFSMMCVAQEAISLSKLEPK